jgi:hypothetical protein
MIVKLEVDNINEYEKDDFIFIENVIQDYETYVYEYTGVIKEIEGNILIVNFFEGFDRERMKKNRYRTTPSIYIR